MEKAHMDRKPTENGEAYLAFVQAHNLHGAMEDIEKLKQAEQLYERATQLDPNFALAFARYSQLESWLGHTFDRAPARRDKARALAERALQLERDLPEAHLAMGFSQYYGDNDFDAAARGICHRATRPAERIRSLSCPRRHPAQAGKWVESNTNWRRPPI
jgi:tetratricopeptide (TPR) repeat protein